MQPTPDRLALWKELLEPANAGLLAAAAKIDPTRLNDIARLRRKTDPRRVALALDLTAARTKAQIKFPDRADRLVADPAGVEQASGPAVAAHKARRFVDAGLTRVADLCCGIGGDTLGLIDAGLDVLAVDHDPVRAWMCARNTGAPTRTADVTTTDLNGRAIHLDPARRNQRGRVFRLEDYQPNPDAIRQLLTDAPAAGVKLSPAINLDDLARQIPLPKLPTSLEFISDHGQLVQAMLWTDTLADTAPRTATRLDAQGIHTLPPPLHPPLPGSPPESFPPAADGFGRASQAIPRGRARGENSGGTSGGGELDRFIHTADAAAERAGLLGLLAGMHGLRLPHPRLGLLTGSQAVDSPWLTPFEVLADMPWQPRRVKQWLADHDAGLITVKTRGKAVNPDTEQARLRGRGDTAYVVFVMRWDRPLRAIITAPPGSPRKPPEISGSFHHDRRE